MENKQFLNLEIKQEELTEEGTFKGYAAMFGNQDSYGDIIEKGAFLKTINEKGCRIKLLWQHNTREIIGKFTSMREDEKGLFVEGKLFLGGDVPLATQAYRLLKEGAITGMSIGYRTLKERFDAEKKNIRYLEEVDLFEASLVTFPANMEATVTDVKSEGEKKREINIKIDDVKDLKDITIFLKEHGLTKTERNAIVKKIKEHVISDYEQKKAGEMLESELKDLVTKAKDFLVQEMK